MVQRLKTHRDGLKENLFFFCGRCAMKTIQGGVLRSLICSWVGVGGSNWLVVGWSDGCLMWVESGPRCRCIKKNWDHDSLSDTRQSQGQRANPDIQFREKKLRHHDFCFNHDFLEFPVTSPLNLSVDCWLCMPCHVIDISITFLFYPIYTVVQSVFFWGVQCSPHI